MMQLGPTRPRLMNLWHAEFNVVPIFFFYPTSVSILWRTCASNYPIACRFHMNYRWYQIILRVEQLYTNRERCEVLTGCLLWVLWTGGAWTNTWYWAICFKILF